jgi:hypothetical protein
MVFMIPPLFCAERRLLCLLQGAADERERPQTGEIAWELPLPTAQHSILRGNRHAKKPCLAKELTRKYYGTAAAR